jgi:hypothetical protein
MQSNKIPRYVYNNGIVMGASAEVDYQANTALTLNRPCRLSPYRAIVPYVKFAATGTLWFRLTYTPDGRSITQGAAVSVATGNLYSVSVARLSDIKAVAAWCLGGVLYGCVLNVSTNTITPATIYSPLSTSSCHAVLDSIAISATQVFVLFQNQNEAGIRGAIWNIATNVITNVSERIDLLSFNTTGYGGQIINSGTNEYMLTCSYSSGSNIYRAFQVVSISGTTITSYETALFSVYPCGGHGFMTPVCIIDSTKFMYLHELSSSPYTKYYGLVNVNVATKAVTQGAVTYGVLNNPGSYNNYATIVPFDVTHFLMGVYGDGGQLHIYMSNFKNPNSDQRYYRTSFTGSAEYALPACVVLSSNLGLAYSSDTNNTNSYVHVQAVIRN